MDLRIDALRKSMGEKSAYITSKANIFYYSGFTSEDAYLIITPARAILVTDSRYTVQAKEQAAGFEIFDIKENIPFEEKTVLIEEEHITAGRLERLKKKYPDKEFIRGDEIISRARRIKTGEEIGLIRTAQEIGDAAFTHILDFLKPGISEKSVALELEYFMKKNGAQGLSFETIAASGIRSAMPHGAASDKIIEKGDFLTLDFGCVYKGYCSDMTRTVVIGTASERQREIYNIVLKAQEAALSAIAAGKRCADTDAAARDIIKAHGYGEYFGHGLGHSVGIEIHELPSFSPKSEDILENGHVITVEPGIYIENFGGVRIEDLIVVSDGKAMNLTHSPKNLIEI
ncbi:MAG: aminopeptidase P family protein [Oscillospiraceae bacterium]|nr:aminopeptidase P family protein [Oscillospiraceae bacterium]